LQFLYKLLHRADAKPWIYDQVQMLFGLKQTHQRLAPYLAETHQKTVLDVGAGTGLYRSLVPKTAWYIWLDIDREKLKGFQRRHTLYAAVLGDATQLCLHDHSVDFAFCIALSHHLSDQQLTRLFSELARVVREKMIFLDALDYPDSLISRLLWKYDRGSYPRSAQALCSAIESWFEIEQTEHYTIYHHYILCVGKPRHGV
jgi:ubiquinone/menaquinone biosynthesis C-methylase UbiE